MTKHIPPVSLSPAAQWANVIASRLKLPNALLPRHLRSRRHACRQLSLVSTQFERGRRPLWLSPGGGGRGRGAPARVDPRDPVAARDIDVESAVHRAAHAAA